MFRVDGSESDERIFGTAGENAGSIQSGTEREDAFQGPAAIAGL